MPCCKKKRKFGDYADGQAHHSQASLKVLAAQTLKIASINGLGDMEKLETDLEDEIRWEENRHPPREIIERFFRRCEEVLHTKYMLFFVIVLNIIDCLLVMSALWLDFFYVSNRFMAHTEHSREFLSLLKTQYSPQLDGLRDVEEDNLTVLYNRFLNSYIFWDAADYDPSLLETDCMFQDFNYSSSMTNVMSVMNMTKNNSVLYPLLTFATTNHDKLGPMRHNNYDVLKISHALHYASISILGFLLFETLLKIACVGKRFLKKKMEMFDAVVIVISFTLDIVFVDGLTNLNLENFVIIVIFVLPWRVLRVVNSMIVAVMAQHRIHLKLLYKQKRKVSKQYHESADRVKHLEKEVGILRGLCKSKGMQDWEINKSLGQTLSANGKEGGLKALSKLVFHAAESFTPMSNTPQSENRLAELFKQTSSTPSVTVQCNGDVEHDGANGHVYGLGQDEFRVEHEQVQAGSSVHGDAAIHSQTPYTQKSEKEEDNSDEPETDEEIDIEDDSPASPGSKLYIPVNTPVSNDAASPESAEASQEATMSYTVAPKSDSKDTPVSKGTASSDYAPVSKDSQAPGDAPVNIDTPVSEVPIVSPINRAHSDAPVPKDVAVAKDVPMSVDELDFVDKSIGVGADTTKL